MGGPSSVGEEIRNIQHRRHFGATEMTLARSPAQVFKDSGTAEGLQGLEDSLTDGVFLICVYMGAKLKLIGIRQKPPSPKQKGQVLWAVQRKVTTLWPGGLGRFQRGNVCVNLAPCLAHSRCLKILLNK